MTLSISRAIAGAAVLFALAAGPALAMGSVGGFGSMPHLTFPTPSVPDSDPRAPGK